MLYFPDIYSDMEQSWKSMNLWEILTQSTMGSTFLNNSSLC